MAPTRANWAFERAHGGTLVLTDVETLSLQTQGKLVQIFIAPSLSGW